MRGIERIEVSQVPRSLFDLSHEWKGTAEAGDLVPICVEPVLPGDKWKVGTELYIRMQPLIAPVMHNLKVFVHWFYVQNRTIMTGVESSDRMNDWERFITGGEDGDETVTMPYLEMSNANKAHFASGGLPDLMGIAVLDSGTTYTNTKKICSLPFRAYQFIVDEYYRDPNVTDRNYSTYADEGEEASYPIVLTKRKRLWLKDYFTSATPWTIRGADTGIPIQGNDEQSYVVDSTTGVPPAALTDLYARGTSGKLTNSGTTADYSLFGGQNIDTGELRNALRVTEWLEKNLKAGGRYVDQLLVHWGVTIPDLNYRPKYLGGGMVQMQVDEILNTSDTTNAEQGNPAGKVMGFNNINGFEQEFPDHGWLMCLMSIMVENGYSSQGVPKKFTMFDKFDYPWQEFANIGDEQIDKDELYLGTDLSAETGNAFGYNGRYQSWKEKYNYCTEAMRDDYDHWNLNRQFSSVPSLNTTFLNHNPRMSDVMPTTITSDYFMIQAWHDIKALRPLPYESKPGIL